MTIKVAMDSETQKNVDQWLTGSYDDKTKAEIRRLREQAPNELVDAFYQKLSFGTGGLRGIMGVGTNRMNQYTVAFATQGLANYIAGQPKGSKKGVLIGYDSRNNSKFFAEECAKVLAANNIPVYLYKEMLPVALLSFGLLYKGCIAGVMITASHNPPKYNGYKVWWENGAQVLPPHDQGIIAEVNRIDDPKKVKTGPLSSPLITEVGEEIEKAYIETLRSLQLTPALNQTKGKNLKIVYTPLHGTGVEIIPRVLSDWGFKTLSLVKEQCVPDGNFPTVKSPNPEESETLKMGSAQLLKENGDILLATDPDADRFAVVCLHHKKLSSLNGNEMASLLAEHICRSLKEAKQFPAKAMFIKTIVTTELFKAIVENYGGICLDVLTGFKYIGEKIAEWEEDKKAAVTPHHYIFGGEESYGCLFGTHARDKDAIICCALTAEMASKLKAEGKTLIDALYALYHKYGVYREKLASFTFEGKEGMEKIRTIMTQLRQNPPTSIGEVAVTTIEDYLTHTRKFVESGKTETLVLPKSDVLRFWLSDHTRIVVRPSGTEPKLKIYCATFDKQMLIDEKAIETAIDRCDKKAEEYLNWLKQHVEQKHHRE